METNSSWTGFYWWVGLVNKLLFSVKERMPGLSLEQLKSQMHTNPKCSLFHWRTTSIIVPFTCRRTDCWFCNQLFTEMFVLVVSKSWSFPVISSSSSLINVLFRYHPTQFSSGYRFKIASWCSPVISTNCDLYNTNVVSGFTLYPKVRLFSVKVGCCWRYPANRPEVYCMDHCL